MTKGIMLLGHEQLQWSLQMRKILDRFDRESKNKMRQSIYELFDRLKYLVSNVYV